MSFWITTSHNSPRHIVRSTPEGVRPGLVWGSVFSRTMETLWKILLEPSVVEFYPAQPQKDQQVCSTIKMMMPGSRKGLRHFQRTHRTLFQDSNLHWRRMSVVRDTFLTVEMALPTPRISGMGTGVEGMTLVSLPIQKLASSFHGTVRPDWVMSLEPLELWLWPDLREFTMACPKQCGDGIRSSNNKSSNMAAAGDWYGFRYHVSTHRVEYTHLSRQETLETGLAGKDALTGLQGTVVRLWIAREGEEGSSERKRRHEWEDLCLGARSKEPEMRKAWQVWQLTRTRFENPVRVEPVMLYPPTG